MLTATHQVPTAKSPSQSFDFGQTSLIVGLLAACLLAVGVSTVDGVKELITPQFDDRLPLILGILGAVAFSAFLSGI